MKVYKVVRECGEHWCSALAEQVGIKLLYREGHVTRPDFGKLFAFSSKVSAVEFVKNVTGVGCVFEAEATETHSPPSFVPSVAHCTLKELRGFWIGTPPFIYPIPCNTVLCDDIKLLCKLYTSR